MTQKEINLSKEDFIQIKIVGYGTFFLEKGESVLSMLQRKKMVTFSNCAGNGVCQRCVVQFTKGAPLPLPADRRRFSPEELRMGYRLACKAKPQMECELICHFSEKKMHILMGGENKHLLLNKKENSGQPAIVAIDLGTTTVAMQLMDQKTGNVLDSYSFLNPQRAFGADVITRMQQSLAGNRERMEKETKSYIEKGINLWKNAGFDIKLAFLAANTVMNHILQGFDVEKLAKNPFIPVTLEEQKIEIAGITTVIIPGFSAFVGGDIMSGALFIKDSMNANQKKSAILIDLGTNGEIVLFWQNRIYVTATAAGPAFEGGATTGVYGADLVAIVATLLRENKLDETGLLKEPYFSKGVMADSVFLTQEDIRNLQMAKAAVFAGIETLLQQANISEDDVEQIYIAGGFGYFLDVSAACEIGLLPTSWEKKTLAVGNSALDGAKHYGRKWFDIQSRNQLYLEIENIKQEAVAINLAKTSCFESFYLDAMSLERKNPRSKDVDNS